MLSRRHVNAIDVFAVVVSGTIEVVQKRRDGNRQATFSALDDGEFIALVPR